VPDWYQRLFIDGDMHLSPRGGDLMFRELKTYFLADAVDRHPDP
jgi:hypothetical protein